MSRSKIKPVAAVARFAALAAVLVSTSGLVHAQSDFERVARNLEPVGHVCMVGQNCTRAANLVHAPEAAPAPVAEPVVSTPATPVEPAAEPAAADFDVAATYQLTCFACHSTGAAGAPVTGNAEAWNERLAKGMDVVLTNSVNGLGAMPAKGMCMTCSEDNLRALIEYMAAAAQ